MLGNVPARSKESMTVEEIRAAIHARGWTYRPKFRRRREYAYAVKRNGAELDEKYLGAIDSPKLPARIAALPNSQEPDQTPAPEIHSEHQALDLDSLTTYDPANLDHRGAHDQARRTWLEKWATEHQYKPLRFVSYYKQTYRQPVAAFNREQWRQFLEQAGARDIYYAFIATYAPRSLQYYIEGREQQAAPEIHNDELQDQALDLITYSRASMKYQGPYDQARRASLKRWAEQHGYKSFWYRCGKYSRHHQGGVPAGIEGWTSFLEKAVQYDIYCCYIAAYAPQPLDYYLEDAIRRGEITNLYDDSLVWRPSDHSKPR
jgi:hypothetical protein